MATEGQSDPQQLQLTRIMLKQRCTTQIRLQSSTVRRGEDLSNGACHLVLNLGKAQLLVNNKDRMPRGL